MAVLVQEQPGTADRAACPARLRDDWEKPGVMQSCKEQRCEGVGLGGTGPPTVQHRLTHRTGEDPPCISATPGHHLVHLLGSSQAQ